MQAAAEAAALVVRQASVSFEYEGIGLLFKVGLEDDILVELGFFQ